MADPCTEWVKVRVYSTMLDIFCRTSNRVFVGLPLGKCPLIPLRYSENWRMQREIRNSCPWTKSLRTTWWRRFASLIDSRLSYGCKRDMTSNSYQVWSSRRIVSRFANVSNDIKRAMRYLDPLVKQRLEQEAIHGKDWPNKPVSFRQFYNWLLLLTFSAIERFDHLATRRRSRRATWYPEHCYKLSPC